jgi:hypothetical protein
LGFRQRLNTFNWHFQQFYRLSKVCKMFRLSTLALAVSSEIGKSPLLVNGLVIFSSLAFRVGAPSMKASR